MRNQDFTSERDDDRTPNQGRNGRSTSSSRSDRDSNFDDRSSRDSRDNRDNRYYGQDGDESRREHPVGYSGQGYAGGMANYAHPESRGYGPDPSSYRGQDRDSQYDRGNYQNQNYQPQRSSNQSYQGNYNQGNYGQNQDYQRQRNDQDSSRWGSNQSRDFQTQGNYQGNYGQHNQGRDLQGNYGQHTQANQDSSRWGYNQARDFSGNQGNYGQGGYQGNYGQGFQDTPDRNYDRNFGHNDRARTQGDNNYGASYSTGRNLAQSDTRGRHTGRGPKGYSRSDDRLTEDLNERLTQHPDIDASEIEVKVKDGTVTLTGTVEDRQTKRLIEDLAEEISGVRDVQNQIRVQRGTQGQSSQGTHGQSSQTQGSYGQSSHGQSSQDSKTSGTTETSQASSRTGSKS